MTRIRLPYQTYVDGIRTGDRVVLGRAISIVESSLPADRALAAEILRAILPDTGNSIRIGITGVPGVGKSTFIEAFGQYLTAQEKRIAVLAVDPSSRKTGGSILGDKTRMENLVRDPRAFIRPSAAGAAIGGVARHTRETILLCEAAGYEVILVETVGVGQSETLVKGMTDFFLLLMLAGAGDELQGIKKGIMEMVDAIAVNKADGDNAKRALQAVTEYRQALHLLPATESGVPAQVMPVSSVEARGMDEIWKLIGDYQAATMQSGYFQQNRQAQRIDWLYENVRNALEEQFFNHAGVKGSLAETEKAVENGSMLPDEAARRLIGLFLKP